MKTYAANLTDGTSMNVNAKNRKEAIAAVKMNLRHEGEGVKMERIGLVK